MHSFQNFTITQRYTGLNAYNGYRGPAIRIEPGLLAYQIFEVARDKGLRVLGGTCPTVSIGGGYTTGGGHGLLSSKYGLGADNVLEWDVVTASGARVTATPKQNADLYWALSGGGPGVFAVIVGVTVKAFPDGDVSTAALTFGVESSPSEDAFWSAVEAFHSHMPNWLDQNATVAYVYSRGVFSLQPLTLPDQPADSVRALIAPFLTRLDDIKVPYKLNVTTFPTFLDSYAAYQGPLPYGIIPSAEVQASRLVPRSILESEDKVHALVGVQRHIASLANGSFWIVGTGLALPQKPSAAPFNSVLPAWRDAAIHQNIVGQWDFHVSWEENIAKQKLLLDTVLPALTHLTPSSGAYMNEANEDQSDWKEAFYGRNYARLKRVKQIWDPKSMFYVKTGVGSDEWTVDKEGHLCKVR
ncbi:hypothetical protein NUW58_g8319 [Xylaria curta]|uniref:Uncharacterized protein n=1 Tax=Xylaria curta TaxID=42375 RepID=A0ACC1N8H2_9PEZI|nr:hypothetical protein NUW58_g8319 [Xylaria curta]